MSCAEVLAPPPELCRGAGAAASGGRESCAPRCSQEAWSICWLVLAASVGSRHYDARSRSIVRHLSKMLLVPWRWVRTAEIVFCKEIIKATAPSKVNKQDAEGWDKKRWARYGLIGGGAVAGGVLLAVTGGLATPAIVAGLGLAGTAVAGAGMVGAGAAGFAASVAAFGGLSTALGVSFGAAGAGLVGYKMHRRTSDIQEFEFELMDCSPGLPVTIGIHGWLTDETDSPWKIWGAGGVLVGDDNDGGEAYALRWESTELRTLGQAISKLLESQAQSAAVNLAGSAVLGAAFAAIALPFACAGLFDYVDNSWSVVQQRADRAGEELANSLLARLHGNRPVTLVGYGMGARVIIKCLLALAAAPTGHGIVETCVLIGTPYSADAQEWARASSVCAYRLVNAYNTRDWLLAFAYRANSASGMLGRGVAGLRSVEHVHGSESILENVDLSDHISSSHFAYRDKVKELVCALGTHTGVVDLGLITPDPSLSQQLMAGVSLRRSPSTDKGVKDTGRGVGGVGEREEAVGERPPSPCKLYTEYTEEALLTHFLEDHQLILT